MENVSTLYQFALLTLLSIFSHWAAFKQQLFSFSKVSCQNIPYPLAGAIYTILTILFYLYPLPWFPWYLPFLILLVHLGVKNKRLFICILKDRQTLPKSSILWDILIGAAFFIVALPLLSLVQNGLEWIFTNIFNMEIPKQHFIDFIKQIKEDKASLVLFFTIICIFVPIYEEYLYRANIQTWLKNYFSPLWAIVITSSFFALSHFFTIDTIQGKSVVLASTFLASIYLGLAYERQRSLISSIAFHALVNTTTFLQVIFLTPTPS